MLRFMGFGAFAAVLCWPVAAATLSGALGSADAVVLGNVATLTDNITGASFTINVETVLKGSVSSTAIQVAHPWHYPGGLALAGPISPSTFAVSLHGIWFLRRTATSAWDLIPRSGIGGDPYQLFWSTPAALPAAYAPAFGASLLDTLMLQAAADVEAAAINPQDIRGIIDTYPPAPASPVVQTILARWVAVPAPGFREVGVACMLETGAPGAITQLAQLGPSISAQWASMIATALEQFFRDTTPSSVTQLVQYASASTTAAAMRKAAVRALAAIHTKEALPFLASLLSGSDPYEQGRAYMAWEPSRMDARPRRPGTWYRWAISVSRTRASSKQPTRLPTSLSEASLQPVIRCWPSGLLSGRTGGR